MQPEDEASTQDKPENSPPAEETLASGEEGSDAAPASADPPKTAPSVSAPGSYSPSAPVITTIKPERADTRGGTPVTVFGAGFVPGCKVFAGQEELIGEVIDTFTLRFVTPPLQGRVAIHVESPSGKRTPEPAFLDCIEGPTIFRAIPDEGPTEGGIEVMLDGRGFTDGCTVSLFGTHAPDVKFENPNRIYFTLPPAGEGPLEGTLAVTLLDGLMGRAEGVFRYRPLVPEVTSVEPGTAWVSGGKVVNVRGVDFHAQARVRFGEVWATNVTYRGPDHLEVEVPASEQLGLVDLVLENPDKRWSTLPNAFTYEPVPAPPKIIDVYPKTGLTLGGSAIRIAGDNFTDAVRVLVGDVTAVRRVLGPTLIELDLPARQTAGQVAVEVRLEEISVRVDDAFTYISPKAPKITGVEPRKGPTSGLTRVTIEGENFMKGATVKFGQEPSKSVVVKSATVIEAVTPPAKQGGLVDIEVHLTETGSGVQPQAFRYEAMLPPTISVVSPNRGKVDGGTELSVEGKNFADGCQVLVGGVAVKTKKISGSVLEAYTPPGDDGKLVDVAVKNPDGQTATQKRAFQFDARYRA